MTRKDIIRWTIEWFVANDAAFTEELALRYERESRAEWGGVDNRPWKTPEGRNGRPRKLPDEAAAFRDALASPAAPLEAVAERHGVSRRTMYRLLKRQ